MSVGSHSNNVIIADGLINFLLDKYMCFGKIFTRMVIIFSSSQYNKYGYQMNLEFGNLITQIKAYILIDYRMLLLFIVICL